MGSERQNTKTNIIKLLAVIKTNCNKGFRGMRKVISRFNYRVS